MQNASALQRPTLPVRQSSGLAALYAAAASTGGAELRIR